DLGQSSLEPGDDRAPGRGQLAGEHRVDDVVRALSAEPPAPGAAGRGWVAGVSGFVHHAPLSGAGAARSSLWDAGGPITQAEQRICSGRGPGSRGPSRSTRLLVAPILIGAPLLRPDHHRTKGRSSIGRVPVSKTGG